jgi:molybdopterin converting factor small subunit
MATVYIPTLLQPAAGGASRIDVPGASVRQIIANLEQLHPGIQAKLLDGDRLRPNLSVAVDGEVSPIGLMESVLPDSEVHFVTAISGGASFSLRGA